MLFLILLLLILVSNFAFRLNKHQIGLIRSILTHPNVTPEIKKKVHTVLIHSHNSWIHKKVNTFAGNNKFSSEYKKELYEAAKLGFLKCLLKYNGSTPLYMYADKYLFYEFTISITKQMPLGYLNHYERYIKKVNVSTPTFIGDSNILDVYTREKKTKPVLLETDNNKFIDREKTIEKINYLVKELPEKEQSVFYATFSRHTMESINTAKGAYKQANVSHETYRQRMRKIRYYLKDKLDIT
tara:strand:- start:1065 stop:1787 length:723 start_codon:yes stop_codon:yes gene_type:complete